MEDVVAGSMSIVEAVARIVFEVAGGLLVFKYAKKGQNIS